MPGPVAWIPVPKKDNQIKIKLSKSTSVYRMYMTFTSDIECD